MLSFKAILQKFSSKGEKTGWTYIDLPDDIVAELKLKSRREFRIKGVIDDVPFERMVCFPVKDGTFLVAINGELRKKLGKKEGAQVTVKFEKDTSGALQSQELLDCLREEPQALEQFQSMTQSHQNYFHNYILSAKGADTRAGRIVHSIDAMYKKIDFGTMIRSLKKK